MGEIPHFLRSYNYSVCEWRPIHFPVGGIRGMRVFPFDASKCQRVFLTTSFSVKPHMQYP